jgi:hypothetical protein
MMVIVADTIFEAGRRPCGLNAPHESPGHQHGERVVHRLQLNRPYLGSNGVGHRVGCDVRASRHRAQHSQPLRGHLDAVSTKELGRIGTHAGEG